MSNFKVGETVVAKETVKQWVINGIIATDIYHIKPKEERVILGVDGRGLSFVGLNPKHFYDQQWFEKKAPSLSMTFKEKVKKDREELILMN